MERSDIEQLIPHRDPFLWLDEVTELTESSVSARKFVSADLDVFRGHYPQQPVLPGVLICEALFQAGALLIASTMDSLGDRVPVVTRLNNVQFRRIVRPGETLQLDVELTEQVSQAYFLKGRASVDGKVSVRLEFACTAASVAD